MNRKRIISLVLMLVLSLQLLPLKQMVCWLISNQITEEIVHTSEGGKKTAGFDEVHKYLGCGNAFAIDLLSSQAKQALSHEDEAVHARLADDIPTPPPNI